MILETLLIDKSDAKIYLGKAVIDVIELGLVFFLSFLHVLDEN